MIRAAVLLLWGPAYLAAAQEVPAIVWPEALYNPQPMADDLVLPMPCGGAMAFRPLATPGALGLALKVQGRDFATIAGPFRDGQGKPYLPVGKYEVSRLQLATVDAYASGSPCPSPGMADGRLPASTVAWQEAADFADDWTGWLLAEGQGFPECTADARLCLPRSAGQPAGVRLPTEAEWEFAARGGLAVTPEVFAQALYPMPGGIARHVWSKDNARGQVQPIGTRAPNPLGLHDLYGNVSETMLDRDLGQGTQGPVPIFVVRGGGYYDPPESLKADLRFEAPTHNRSGRVRTSDTGFRVVVSAAEDRAPRALLAEAPEAAPIASAPPRDPVDATGPESSPQRIEAALGLDAEDRQEIRSQLARLGFDPGASDGFSSWLRAHLAQLGGGQPVYDLGQQARVAIARFQKSQVLEPTGYMTAQTREALRAASGALTVGEEGTAKAATEDDRHLAEEQRLATDQQAEDRRLAEEKHRTEAQHLVDERRQARLAALNGVVPAMIELPGGSFRMGSPDSEKGRTKDEGPRHRVALKPFAIGQTEVTFTQYDAFARATGRRMPRDRGAGRGARPVVDVSWLDANAYAAWLREQTGDDYRLPTEAEWEYAARAGTETPFWSGACIGPDQAIYDRSRNYPGCPTNPKGPRRPPAPAGSLPANPWGLHDVAGNVAEWVQDCWHPDYIGAPTDGSPWLQDDDGNCAMRVVRGGGWSYVPWALRSAYRSFSPAASGQDAIGFRVARSL